MTSTSSGRVAPPSSRERRVVEREQGAGVHEQPLAVGGERDAAGAAGEQPRADLRLEPTDVAAQRLLGHEESGWRPG